jgi:hypothetical protein
MKLEIQINAVSYCLYNGKPNQRSAIVVCSTSLDAYGRQAKQMVSQPLGYCNQALADVNCLRVALLTVKPRFRDQEIFLTTNAYYAAVRCLEKKDDGSYVMQPSRNVAEIEAFRNLYATFPKLHLVYLRQGSEQDVEFNNLFELVKKLTEMQRKLDTKLTLPPGCSVKETV